jgi:hypothetical protein
VKGLSLHKVKIHAIKSIVDRDEDGYLQNPNLAELHGSPSQEDNQTHLSSPKKQHIQNLYPS